jgi:3-phosphoshikimate 1-carboxyvinyltransferase
LLLLQALFPNITLENTSNSDDSEVMSKALANSQLTELTIIDIHQAQQCGFLLLILPLAKGEVILTGSQRMQERPIKYW